MRCLLTLVILLTLASCKKDKLVEETQLPAFTPFTLSPSPTTGGATDGQSLDLNEDGISDLACYGYKFQSSAGPIIEEAIIQGMNGAQVALKAEDPQQVNNYDNNQLVTLPNGAFISDTLDFQTGQEGWLAYTLAEPPLGYGAVYVNDENVGSTVQVVGKGQFGKFWVRCEVLGTFSFRITNIGISDIVGENPIIP